MRARTDPELKARAMELARQHGAAEASRETGVSASTIRAWVSRAKTETAEVAAPQPPADRATRTIESAQRAAEAAIRRLEEIIPTARGPQALAIASGVMIDKARQLSEAMAEQREREVQFAEQDAAWLMAAFKTYMAALGLPWSEGGAARRCWAEILRGGQQSEPFTMPPSADVAAARAELRAIVRKEVEAEMQREQRERQQAEQGARRALPPPAEPEPDPEPEDPPEPEPEVETVSGEVVDEPPRRNAHNPPGGWGRYMGGARIPGT